MILKLTVKNINNELIQRTNVPCRHTKSSKNTTLEFTRFVDKQWIFECLTLKMRAEEDIDDFDENRLSNVICHRALCALCFEVTNNYFIANALQKNRFTLEMKVKFTKYTIRNGPTRWHISISVTAILEHFLWLSTFSIYSHFKLRELEHISQNHDVQHSHHSMANIWFNIWWQ